MKIKICGLFRREDIDSVNETLPDYIGFVFAKSRRQVTVEQAEKLRKNLNAGIQTVGVFVNAPKHEVTSLLNNGVIDIAQLHGGEDEEYMMRLKSETHCQIIKSLRVKRAEDILNAQGSPADFLLLDHGAGGTGEAFDWKLIRECRKPYFLAGGIHAGNIDQAMTVGNPFAIDLSSGVETDGVKDKDKILEIIRRMRNV
ncbi:MAG TPA: phosphoribosylanthranilate isomerase [Anaerovoracaceae bacterium]|nr:phosphoribosylanthranilate isomerase [Anaerovoracaceae bacterium]